MNHNSNELELYLLEFFPHLYRESDFASSYLLVFLRNVVYKPHNIIYTIPSHCIYKCNIKMHVSGVQKIMLYNINTNEKVKHS